MTIFSPYLIIAVTLTTQCYLSGVLADQLLPESHEKSNMRTFQAPLVGSESPRSMSYTFILSLLICFILAARTFSASYQPMQSKESSKTQIVQISYSTVSEKDSDYTFLPAPPRPAPRQVDQLRERIGSHKEREGPTHNDNDYYCDYSYLIQSSRSTSSSPILQRKDIEVLERSRCIISADDSNTCSSNQDSGEDEDVYPSGKDFTHWHADISNIPHGPHDKVVYEAYRRPKALLGWKISVSEKGIGVVIRIRKYFGRSTKFQVKFDGGNTEYLSLRRGPKKGKVPFLPINKELI